MVPSGAERACALEKEMTGMMTHMQQISKSARARSGPTEEFVELCKALYGDAVDPDVVWTDVIKLSPDQADVNAQQAKPKGGTLRRVAEGVALASTAAGGVLGVKEGVGAVKDIRAAGGLAKAPAKAVRNLGIAGLAVGGDAITTGVLAATGRNKNQQPPQPVQKGSGFLVPTGNVDEEVEKFSLGAVKDLKLADIKDQVSGLRRLWKPPAAPAEGPGAGKLWQGPETKAQNRVRSAGKDIGTALSTRTGQIGAGAVGLAGAKKLATPSQPQQDYIYGKADDTEVEFRGEFTKFDDEKRQAFGWASVVKVNGQPVVDRQGDYIDMADLEDAAYQYVHKSRVGGDMHKRNGEAAHKVSDMIESMVFTDEKVAKMGLPDDFPRGWWVGYKIHDEDTWSEVRKGGRTGFSIHGKGLRKEHSLDELMGY